MLLLYGNLSLYDGWGINFGLSATAFADKEENMTNRPSTVASALEALTGAH